MWIEGEEERVEKKGKVSRKNERDLKFGMKRKEMD